MDKRFTFNEDVENLNTYLDHRSMDVSTKQLFENEIENTILENDNELHR